MASRPTSARSLPMLVVVIALALFGSACSATAQYVAIEDSAAPPIPPEDALPLSTDAAPDALAFSAQPTATLTPQADAEPTVDAEPEPAPTVVEAPPSPEFCTASSNVWIRSEALEQLGDDANADMTAVAFTRIAEWMERSSLFADSESEGESRVLLFVAFQELETKAVADFDSDWAALQASDFYTDDPAAILYERERGELASFLDESCPELSVAELEADVAIQMRELIDGWGTVASSVSVSATLPGHSILTHPSGRLIASFPTHWEFRELHGDAIVEFIAAQDLEKLEAMEPVEGVHIQLVKADTIEDFLAMVDATTTASSCTFVDEASSGRDPMTEFTRNYACAEHGTLIDARFNADSQAGLILEASFRGPQPTNAQLTRLASVQQSILWS